MQNLTPTSVAYLMALRHVLSHGQKVGPRGQMTLEVEDYHFEVRQPDSSPIMTRSVDRNDVIRDYTKDEMALYLSKSTDVNDFAAASSFWKQLANPDGTINSGYGALIWGREICGNAKFELMRELKLDPGQFEAWQSNDPKAAAKIMSERLRTPWNWAKESLIRDKHTRQAIVRFSTPDHQWFGNKDQICTMHGLFLIRDDKLNLSVVMRSNDLVKGLAYDLPFFVRLMEFMVDELQSTYPGIKVGTYRHMAQSCHIYERDLDKVYAMLGMTRQEAIQQCPALAMAVLQPA